MFPGGPASAAVDVADLPGLERETQILVEMIECSCLHADLFAALHQQPPAGILLYGPPGCGKTALVKHVCQRTAAALVVVSPAVVGGAIVGEAEEQLRELFARAAALPPPCVILLDELDALCPKRDAALSLSVRITALLLTLLDGAAKRAAGTVVIGTSSRPGVIDPALRRPGRLDRELPIPVPGVEARSRMLQALWRCTPLEADVSLPALAERCTGYLPADLAALCREGTMCAAARQATSVSAADVAQAMQRVPPSLRRDADTGEVAPLAWDDVGGLEAAKAVLRQAIEWPLVYAGTFARLGIAAPRGVLLYGPPGCGKTSLARAVASSARIAFFAASCAAVFSPYVGEAERFIRDLFLRARQSAPAVVFLDEIDALVCDRAAAGSGGVDVAARVLSTLLNELDGVQSAGQVLLLAATNRPQAVDAALRRPGRLDYAVYVPPPDRAARLAVLAVHTRRMPLAPDVSLAHWAEQTEHCSAADLANLCREAALAALRRALDRPGAAPTAVQVAHSDWEAAMAGLRPSLTAAVLAEYGPLPGASAAPV